MNTDEERRDDSRSGESVPEKKKPSTKGFASMSPEKRRNAASKGGKAAHALGRAHKFTEQEAKEAGRIGGSKSRRGSARKPQSEGTNGP